MTANKALPHIAAQTLNTRLNMRLRQAVQTLYGNYIRIRVIKTMI